MSAFRRFRFWPIAASHKDLLSSVLNHAPFYIERENKWAADMEPSCLKFNHIYVANFDSKVPAGDLVRLSPDEMSHVVLLRVYSRLKEGADKT